MITSILNLKFFPILASLPHLVPLANTDSHITGKPPWKELVHWHWLVTVIFSTVAKPPFQLLVHSNYCVSLLYVMPIPLPFLCSDANSLPMLKSQNHVLSHTFCSFQNSPSLVHLKSRTPLLDQWNGRNCWRRNSHKATMVAMENR